MNSSDVKLTNYAVGKILVQVCYNIERTISNNAQSFPVTLSLSLNVLKIEIELNFFFSFTNIVNLNPKQCLVLTYFTMLALSDPTY